MRCLNHEVIQEKTALCSSNEVAADRHTFCNHIKQNDATVVHSLHHLN